jgi:ferrous iron transport protein A
VRLSDLKKQQRAIIRQVYHETDTETTDQIALRLIHLGFVAGESVEVITRGIFGGEPILVKIAGSRFALRHNEAKRIEIQA